jgi:hypothetical protein
MAKKNLWLGILVLVFGMTVVGCDDGLDKEALVTSSPTGLQGIVISPNNSVRLTWNSVSNAEEYWIERNPYGWGWNNSWTSSGKSTATSYTVTDLDYLTSYSFRVYGIVYDGGGPYYSSPITIDTGKPLTGTVSLSMETTYSNNSWDYLTPHWYTVSVTLTLSGGPWWDIVDSITNQNVIRSWINFSGSPSIGDWSINLGGFSGLGRSRSFKIDLFRHSATPISISGLTATINASKISEMNNYTQIVNSLSVGSPSTASSSVWAQE